MRILVLDSINDPGFKVDYSTKQPFTFLKKVFDEKNALVVVDEAGEAIGRYNGPMNKIATQGRHLGHICIFITQRYTQLDPIVREQCGGIVLFNCSKSVAKYWAEEFNDDSLLQASDLKRGEFLFKQRLEPIMKIDAFSLT